MKNKKPNITVIIISIVIAVLLITILIWKYQPQVPYTPGKNITNTSIPDGPTAGE